MSAKRFEGRNLDEAISNAASAFGVEAYRLNYHIVIQKRGFLGGTKRVVIEAEPGEGIREDLLVEDPPETPRKPAIPRPAPRRDSAGPESRTRQSRPERSGGRRDGGRDRGRRGGRERRRDEEIERFDDEKSEPEEIPVQGERSEDQTRIATWCEELIRLSGLDLVIRTSETDEEIEVALHGPDRRALTGRGGELLDSFQVLANKAFVGRSIEKRIEFDAGGFKKKREAELGEKALDLAATVRREGRERLLPAMTPIERRIIHMTLRDVEGVDTVSRGNGFLKRVAIVPHAGSKPVDEAGE